ncbi:MAG: glycosyltransferase family 2 protein, partial [Candidatus Omnitrophica bacterium]|nr:glycosyltransferase family 2 protein [Candidatus Omnitrophota bacterium]
PDYQYSPKLVAPMASLIASGMFDVVLGSRILGGCALKGGMPFYKYIANRLLTAFENIFTGQKLSEYHTGFRAYSREALSNIPFLKNSNDFVFDNEILAQVFYFKYRIGEISSPCSYNKDCSSISFRRSIIYGLGVLQTTVRYILAKYDLRKDPIFKR